MAEVYSRFFYEPSLYPTMPEILLHYIWQAGLFHSFPQYTTDGRPVRVLSIGLHNTHAGPDFTNVHLQIDGIEWVGNVEIHVKSSDWYTHHHHVDAAYDSVILHVVKQVDKPVYNTQGQQIPQLELQYPTDQDYLNECLVEARKMDSAQGTHRCANQLLSDPMLLTHGWKQTMLHHRLECKRASIQHLLELTVNDYEQALYIMLARQFGFHVNSLPMEQLALQTPLSILRKHRNSLFQIEAILLGQSGLLTRGEASNLDESEQQLLNEYLFLQKKFSLRPINATLWKHGRLRPQNQPQVRLRQLAKLICLHEVLQSKLLECHQLSELRELFAPIGMGRDSIDVLILNVVVPMKYCKGQQKEALAILESIPPEKNNIIQQWHLLGQTIRNAADSQALIHLYTSYCQSDKCINCEVAYQIFRTKQLNLFEQNT